MKTKVKCSSCPVRHACTIEKIEPEIPKIEGKTHEELGLMFFPPPIIKPRDPLQCPLVKLLMTNEAYNSTEVNDGSSNK